MRYIITFNIYFSFDKYNGGWSMHVYHVTIICKENKFMLFTYTEQQINVSWHPYYNTILISALDRLPNWLRSVVESRGDLWHLPRPNPCMFRASATQTIKHVTSYK